ncbi:MULTISPECIES: hypothetical protein [unclassified Streptomyces]|uniref:hypothetical protein n=1 Tax=unclassified Streptomyces TaxID=2593676 RepID=UPI0014890CF2|nr:MULTISPECIES: hypothetical protein [unclassified Streptomyces]
MSARDDIHRLFESGRTSYHLDGYLAAHRAEVLHEAADFVGNDDDCGCGGCDTCVPRKLAEGLREMAGAPRGGVLSTTEQFPGELVMFRGLVRTLRVAARFEDMAEVQRLLYEHDADERAAHTEAQEKSSPDGAGATPDFFQPGHTYSKGQDGYKAPEQTWQFRCVAIADHPREDAGRRAFGFMRQGIGRWESVGVREGEFERGWTDITDHTRKDSRS